jgi:monoamine oxidase
VDVLTTRGSFQASYVLVTVPLGVLQAGRIAFHPHLPKGKREAIRKTGMGVFNKIFLEFGSVFWDQEDQLIGYMGARTKTGPRSSTSTGSPASPCCSLSAQEWPARRTSSGAIPSWWPA